MGVTYKEVRRVAIYGLITVLIALSFIVIRPIILSIVTGLILAYAFIPLYKRLYKVFREKNTTAFAICILLFLLILIPLWFLIPLIMQQSFQLFNQFQSVDVKPIIESIFPGSSPQFQKDMSSIVVTFIGNITNFVLSSLTGFLLNLPTILLHTAVILFVFFFTIRDHEILKEFLLGLSPLKREKSREIARQFKDITSSIVFGYVFVGIIQGIATGIGLFIFQVPNPIVLTLVAIGASMFPLLGAWLVWIPVAIYLFVNGDPTPAIIFTLYCALFVSSIDNILRPYIVSRKTGISSAIVLIGMIGGLFVFGILGIMLGPLILSYLIVFLRAYKERKLDELFESEE